MSEKEIGLFILTLGVIVGLVQVLGYVFERLKQPRLVGEIIAGILIGPFVLGQLSPALFTLLFENPAAGGQNKTSIVLGFVYWLGILLLMFISGSHVRRLLSKENRRETAWILGVGTPLPFFLVLGLGLASVIPIDPLVGVKGVKTATLLVLASAVAVTSIPVISRIFHDLKILHTRFASLVLGFAVLEDIVLWGVLAVVSVRTERAGIDIHSLGDDARLHGCRADSSAGPAEARAAVTAKSLVQILTAGVRHLRPVRVRRDSRLSGREPGICGVPGGVWVGGRHCRRRAAVLY